MLLKQDDVFNNESNFLSVQREHTNDWDWHFAVFTEKMSDIRYTVYKGWTPWW